MAFAFSIFILLSRISSASDKYNFNSASRCSLILRILSGSGAEGEGEALQIAGGGLSCPHFLHFALVPKILNLHV